MRFHFFAFETHLTALLEKTFTLIWAVYNLKGTVNCNMTLHLTSLNLPSAFVLALDYSLRALMRNMFFHVVQR
jgi:hypothetical protein